MVKELIKTTICILFLVTSFTLGQEPVDGLAPLSATRKQVIKILGDPTRINVNQFVYDIAPNITTITFYKLGCPTEIEKKLKLSSNTVLEIKTVSKQQRKISDVLDINATYKVYKEHGGEKLYFDSRGGIVIATSMIGSEELAKAVYRVPPGGFLENCLFDSLDSESGIAELHYFGAIKSNGDKFKFPPIKAGQYFDEDSDKSKSYVIDRFVKALAEHENGIGYINIFATAVESPSTFSNKQRKLLALLKEKGISCSRIAILNGGVGPLAGASYVVMHRSFLAESGLKTKCD
jgi:hypothetical protein